ncbi:histidinol-phosphate transaminase [Salinivibrio socompensis]|uniref:histidinol-phosphate transaminase n=1 Tax=Salinivibrio socompensis TaxID=1510206 RepID=UPI00046EE413|nr:histidinol-phosphate transaminase [Salinivibrio socompensis]
MDKLAREQVQALTPYQSARRIGGSGDVWLNANESPFDNTYTLSGQGLNRYSSCQPAALINAYADYAGVETGQVITTRGADEGIDLLLRAFCEPNQDSVLICPPTYGMYAVSAENQGIAATQVPLTADWQLDMAGIDSALEADASIKLIFVCSPNNPTGNLINRDDIEALLTRTQDRAMVVLDEAYIEFSPEATCTDLLARFENLAILRTLSKAFALAGLRCGFTLASPAIINLMLKVIPPYPVPVPVADIAQQALSEAGLARMKYQVLDLTANRAYLQAGLSMLPGVEVHPGFGNYLLITLDDADAVFERLGNAGIIVRRTAVANSLRISIGNRDECEKVLAFIRQQLSE